MTDIYTIVYTAMHDPDEPRKWGEYRKVELLGVGEFAERVGLKKSTVYVYHSTGKLPEPDLVVNGGNTALWLDTTVDEWKKER